MADKKEMSLLKSFIAGGVGGVCLVGVGHPFDLVKVRYQSGTAEGNVMSAVNQIYKLEGVRGFYKGMAAPIAGVTPMYALCFFGYGVGKKIFCDEDTFRDINAYKMVQIGLAGATSAIFTTPILAPGERIKCYLQVQGAGGKAAKFNGPIDLAKHLYKTGGMASLNRGFCGTWARDSVASLAYFSTYEFLKAQFTPKDGTPSVGGTFLAGGFAGMLNWLVALPLDTLKTKLQLAPDGQYKHGIRSVFVDMMFTQKLGIASLYKGFIPTMARAFPANAACFLGYEAAVKSLTWAGID
eukprot:m.267243 g.267243  ORF g.267243 m.267243 type:complete len:296 (+) comp32667_c0_seq1:139-1026(+)